MSIRFSVIPVTSYQQNCSILICNQTNKAAIVDPGGDIELILDVLADENAIPEVILVTHGHLDHIGGVAELASKLSIPIEGPQSEDQFWIDSLPSQIQTFGFPPCETFTRTHWLNDGDTVHFGEQELQAITDNLLVLVLLVVVAGALECKYRQRGSRRIAEHRRPAILFCKVG